MASSALILNLFNQAKDEVSHNVRDEFRYAFPTEALSLDSGLAVEAGGTRRQAMLDHLEGLV